MAEVDFVGAVHRATKRDYVGRVLEADKAECANIAGRFDRDYWDGERRHGYGGYRYDGRWRPVAEAMARHYGLEPGQSVLDVGCGKAFLLYELTQVVPGLGVHGIDISDYAVANAKEEVRDRLRVGDATSLPYAEDSFDLVISLATLHNLPIQRLWTALQEMERVSRKDKYVMIESYRNEREKVNLLYWQLTCQSFHSVEAWNFIFSQTGYTGDHSFIFFE